MSELNLTDYEIGVFDVNHSEEKRRKIEIVNFDLKKKNLELRRRYLVKEYELNLKLLEEEGRKLTNALNNTVVKHKGEREKHKGFVSEIENRLELEGKWGFDPETGEIIFEDED